MLRNPCPGRGRSGFALLDVCIALLVLVVAMGVLLGSIFSAMRLAQVNESTAAANQALRGVLETLNALPIDQALVACQDGKKLAIAPEVLRDVHGDPLVAEVVLPLAKTGELREDLDLPELGMPRDLDEDGQIDAKDHAANYKVLPLALKLAWDGPSGPQTVQLATVLRAR